ncbi:MAG: undecaprenyl/decaprenyl-phosphate alpha-N-acetylglucosaminyl 1-phosphate transferase [Solirubrobacterales bacterium]|nr:undecaprenyl/decaprenyl-phosphate alpha-N-acetylglucosaminyl 1-phosphate transferase [Solirubrobacterales bacterium]
MTEGDALLAFLVAFAVAALLTPLTARFARLVGAVDKPKDRGLSREETPLLGGIAMLGAVLVASALLLDFGPILDERLKGILLGASIIALIGAVDDRFELPPAAKLGGQILAAYFPVQAGVEVSNITLPLVGAQDLGDAGTVLTIAGLVVVMNVVNLSDGIDGLAAGVCAISAITFTIIAFDLNRGHAAVLAAITAGAALGFLVHNFHPASVFMGDCGSNLLGLLLGSIAIEGAVKTQAVLALVFPLVVLAVPFVDTTFVVLKRLKYKRKPWEADANHFHHRFSRIGFSQRRTVVYLYAWTLLLGGFAVALRFVRYSDDSGNLLLPGSLAMGALALVVLAGSVYLVYVLEILKFRRLDARRLRRARPGVTAAEIDADVEVRLGTGEFEAVRRETEDVARGQLP